MKNMVMFKKGKDAWINYIKKRIRSNLNFIAIAEGSTGCLSKDTLIAGQTQSLGDLYSSGKRFIDTISITQSPTKKRKGGYYPKKSKSEIIPSGIKEVYEITLEDGRKVLATEEHIFFKIEGNKSKEERVCNLKVGDTLKTYPKDYQKQYIKKIIKGNNNKKFQNYTPKRICQRCNSLFFVEFNTTKTKGQCCKTCLEQYKIGKKRNHKKMWYEWEINLLRQFYYGWKKKKLQELLPHRSWISIIKKARKIGLKRKDELRWKQNAWTSKNNPIHNPILKEKMIQNKQKQIFKRNKMTSIEEKVSKLLDKHKIKYEFNKVVRTKTTFRFPDFKIGNLIIECDGIYWHQMRKDDEARQKELEKQGFEFLRFTDKEINNNIKGVEECIKQKLNL